MTTKHPRYTLSRYYAAMARYSQAEIDAALAEYPESDGMPLPDGLQQEPEFTEIRGTVREFFRNRTDVIVSGDTFVYYEEGTQRRVAPDCYVAFGVSEADVPPYNSYLILRMGKPPDFVLEIGSKSTARRDLIEKPGLYARIGVGEYWRYDPTANSQHYGERLVGEKLVDGQYVRLPLETTADGIPWGHSPALGLDLYWQGKPDALRFYDPVAGRYLPTRAEQTNRLRASEDARRASEDARRAAEAAELRERLRRLQQE